MAHCSLLRMGGSPAEQAAFSFEHAMAHRTLTGGMPNITKLSVLPYQIDPMEFSNPKYLLNHQQAHLDVQERLPVKTVPFGQNLIDTTGNLQWWTFANHQEHLAALAQLPPILGPYPFW